MEFVYLGTAAAEGWPALVLFLQCLPSGERKGRPQCPRPVSGAGGWRAAAGSAGGHLFRTLEGRLDLTAVRHCLITHSHSDHLYPADLEMRRTGFAHPADSRPFVLYGTKTAGREIRSVLKKYGLEPGWAGAFSADKAL